MPFRWRSIRFVVEAIFRQQNRLRRANECLMALLHDAPEYVIGDMISPFKAVVGGGYKTVEKRLEAAVHLRFGLPPATPAEPESARSRRPTRSPPSSRRPSLPASD
jgi:5'-deoxynucleotidase YfbR-like HD superfamily hydrolase